MKDDVKPSEGWQKSTQDVWSPQGEHLQGLYDSGADWQTANQGAINTASQNAQNFSTGARDAVAPAWIQQLQGGNLGGYDIAGELAGRLGQNKDITAQTVNPNQFQGRDINTYGVDNRTAEYQAGQAYSGGNSSLQNMMGTMSSAAREAQDNMLGGLDARAAASGASGGSRHGTAIRGGMRDINQNLQDNISNIGYDAYNRDYDRALQTGQNQDQYNNQINLANQSDTFNVNQSNQQAALQAAQGNQDSALRAGQANQDYASGQQQQLGDLINQQNMNTQGAIGQQEQVANYINGPMQSLMSSTAGMDFLSRMLGGPTTLTQSEGADNGGTPHNSGSVNIGNVGVKY